MVTCAPMGAAVRSVGNGVCTACPWLPPTRHLYSQVRAPVLSQQALDLAFSEQGLCSASLGTCSIWGDVLFLESEVWGRLTSRPGPACRHCLVPEPQVRDDDDGACLPEGLNLGHSV